MKNFTFTKNDSIISDSSSNNKQIDSPPSLLASPAHMKSFSILSLQIPSLKTRKTLDSIDSLVNFYKMNKK